MKCTITDCTGEYENRQITHTVTKNDKVFVFNHVPAEVCPVCGDVLLSPDTLKKIEQTLEGQVKPSAMVPMFEYA